MDNQDIVSPSLTCSCKGCRYCLICQPSLDDQSFISSKKLNFYYCPHLGCAIGKSKSTGAFWSHPFIGASIIDNILTEEEEKSVVDFMDKNNWKNSQSGRRKQDYGPKVNFKKKKVKMNPFTGLPTYAKSIVEKINNVVGFENFVPVEQCNLEYVPERGSCINPHFDDEWLWGERLISLNFLSDTMFTMLREDDSITRVYKLDSKSLEEHGCDCPTLYDFEPCDVESCQGDISFNDIVIRIPLRRRSLVSLANQARFEWKHAIMRTDIKHRRISCVFRELSESFINGENRDIGETLIKRALTFAGTTVD